MAAREIIALPFLLLSLGLFHIEEITKKYVAPSISWIACKVSIAAFRIAGRSIYDDAAKGE